MSPSINDCWMARFCGSWESFTPISPVPIAINPVEFVEAPPGKWEAESRDLRATLGRAALEMLDEIECIRHGDITRIGDGTWPNVVLTARGLARMRERPENETDEEKILRIFRRD